MAKQKVSATVSPERLARAREVAGTSNVSEVLDLALDALIERELERQWIAGHRRIGPEDDLPVEVAPDLGDLPWDDRT